MRKAKSKTPWEGSKQDEKADKAAGKKHHEGSALDKKADAAAVKAKSKGKDPVAAHEKTEKIGNPQLHWAKDKKPKETKTDRGTFAFK